MALNDVPLAGQSLNASRNLIESNFLTINTAFKQDHGEYSLPNQGKHNTVTFPLQTYVLPLKGPSTLGTTDMVLFTRDSLAVPGTPGMFLVPANTDPANPLTPSIEFSYALKANPGYTILPSGIIIQWALGALGSGSSSAVIALPIKFSTFLTCQGTVNTFAGNERDNIIYAKPSGFKAVEIGRAATWNSGNITVNVLAIGY